ncbi:MAG: hypothetical protein ACRDJM_09275 [Actinomycetota bacterium]
MTVEGDVPGFGGPTAIDEDLSDDLQQMHLFGRGVGLELVARGRTGIGVANLADDVIYTAPVAPGDSGAPLLSQDGRALGIHVAQGMIISVTPAIAAGHAFATRIGPAIRAAERALNLELTIQTAQFHGGLVYP